MQTKPHREIFKDLVFGTRPVLEALESGKEVNKILLLRGGSTDTIQQITQLAKEKRIPVQKVPVEKLNRITRKNHQGVLAFISPIEYDKLEEVIPMLFEKGLNPLILVLDQITDVRNVGAICRSAECLGAQAVVIPSRGGALINSDAAKTSAGAIFNLKVCRADDLYSALTLLKNSGLKIVACTEKTDKNVQDCSLDGPTAIVMGAEDLGISPPLMKLADERVRIPMLGQTESLNVAVSAGIVLYECLKQRASIELQE